MKTKALISCAATAQLIIAFVFAYVKCFSHDENHLFCDKQGILIPIGQQGIQYWYFFLARLYESTGRAIAVTPASALASASALLKMLKFLVKVFMSLYLLKLLMDQVDTLHVGRYWSEVLCCTIMTHLGDLEVKVTDLEIFC